MPSTTSQLQKSRPSSSEIRRRALELLDLVQLSGLEKRYPHQLSGGQRQRVAMGRAIVRDPQVFLFDEPLSNLDAALRVQTRIEIARLHEKMAGTTMIYVTHDQIEAMTLGQRIVVLKDGHIQQIDTPMALYERPANLFVATFLGSPAMNVLRGTLTQSAAGWTFDAGEGITLALGDAGFPADWGGRVIDLGIRPEHLLPSAEGDAMLAPLVEVVEPVGSEVFVNLRLGAHALIARLPPDRVPVAGERLPLTIPVGRVHAFDIDTGARLAVGD